MKRRFLRGMGVAFLAAACAAVLAGCSGVPQLPFGNPLDKLFETTSVASARNAKAAARPVALAAPDLVTDGYLTVGLQTEAVSAPFCILDANGTVSGMDVDIASAIAGELGLQVRFVPVADVASPLASSVCDIVMDASSEHSGGATVVGGYYESAAAFFHRGASGAVDVSALNAATVGLQEGSVSEGVLNRTGLVMTERTYANLNEAFDALKAESVDYVLCDAYPGAYLAATYEGINFAGALNAPLSVGIAVASEKVTTQTLVKQALDTISSNGVMDIIRARWIGSMPSITPVDEIQNVPGAIGDAAEGASDEAESVPDAVEEGTQDGSTAGSNAVTI